MRTALLSDIHGNLEAFRAVLIDLKKRQIDRILCLGDVIGYGADPQACLELVSKLCEVCIMGNHEYAVLGLQSTEYYNAAAREATNWTRSQLSDSDLTTLREFQLEYLMDDCQLVHASPAEPSRFPYILGQEHAQSAFDSARSKICFHGHTHIPMIAVENSTGEPRVRTGHSFEPDPDQRYLVNVGSVGQPRDNDPRACYVIFDHDEYQITYYRVEYDIETAQRKMSEAGLPFVLADRLSAGV